MAIETRKAPLKLRKDGRWEVAGVALTSGSFLEVMRGGAYFAGELRLESDGKYIVVNTVTDDSLEPQEGWMARIRIRFSH